MVQLNDMYNLPTATLLDDSYREDVEDLNLKLLPLKTMTIMSSLLHDEKNNGNEILPKEKDGVVEAVVGSKRTSTVCPAVRLRLVPICTGKEYHRFVKDNSAGCN